jgi:histidine triad (HIT) family protein
MNQKEECIFCKIAKGDIPCMKIAESKDFLAFLDIKPTAKGHTLVIPKHHCENILDFPKAEETDFVEFIKKVSAMVKKGVNADAFNLGMNNGPEAGQVVFHAHMHIIPRFKGDALKSWPNKDVPKEELEQTHKKIISQE